jgi:hypothetical protein
MLLFIWVYSFNKHLINVLFYKGLQGKRHIFLFTKTLNLYLPPSFYSNIKLIKFSGELLKYQNTYIKPFNKHACLDKLEN